jgi:hypothetical protein
VVVALAAGQHLVVDAHAEPCLRFNASGVEQQYLLAITSGSGKVVESGVFGPFTLAVTVPAGPAPPAQAPPAPPESRPGAPERFHSGLRAREQELARDPAARAMALRAPSLLVPPTLGSKDTFKVCRNITCDAFDDVIAAARYVGTHAAIYLDDTIPDSPILEPLKQEDFDELGRLFDTYHHPIARDAFGIESDIDANGVVLILLTDAVNNLTPDCKNGRIIGYFYGADLLNLAGSNHAEIFYGMVPAPATTGCSTATRGRVMDDLKPTLIHELQHMISFNEKVFVRNTRETEVTWLNEGLSHAAEELAGRLIPATECPTAPSCRSLYISGDLENAYEYLEDTEAHFLVSAESSTGTLEERGSAWLFVRWLADQFGTDSLGLNVTRALVQTRLVGSANIEAVTGQPFSTLVAEWLPTTYLDDLTGFAAASPRLRFTSWGFRTVFQNNCCVSGAPFPVVFPTVPPAMSAPSSRSGTLRGGSGRLLLLSVPAGAGRDVLAARSPGGAVLDPALVPRYTVVRLP